MIVVSPLFGDLESQIINIGFFYFISCKFLHKIDLYRFHIKLFSWDKHRDEGIQDLLDLKTLSMSIPFIPKDYEPVIFHQEYKRNIISEQVFLFHWG